MENTLIQGKAKDWCSKCKNGTCYLKDSDTYICTDPYDNEERAIGAQTDIECTMFEPDSGRYPWSHCDTKMDVIYEDDKVRAIKVTGWGNEEDKEFHILISDLYKQIQDLKSDNARLDRLYSERDRELNGLIKASKRKDELIQDYREKLKVYKDKYEKLDTHYQYDEAIIKDIQDVISPEDNSIWSHSEIVNEITKLKNENISLNTINKGLAEDRKKLINYMRSLKIASENYLKEFTYGEENEND